MIAYSDQALILWNQAGKTRNRFPYPCGRNRPDLVLLGADGRSLGAVLRKLFKLGNLFAPDDATPENGASPGKKESVFDRALPRRVGEEGGGMKLRLESFEKVFILSVSQSVGTGDVQILLAGINKVLRMGRSCLVVNFGDALVHDKAADFN